MDLPEGLLALLHRPSTCYLATSMADGSPHLTQTWVDTDGEHILINSVQGFQKIKNIERDPRVAVTVSDPDNPSRYYAVRGRVLSVTADGARDHIEKLSQRYLGGPYPWFGGRDQTRLVLTIEAQKISFTG
ncbi:PPOX class F420-dependent oxidoreductase [Planosporangium mesophilum]|uniref:PPOX class F420-dependent oxidoreductase n=1 Tax=Planosporangium mesophilum TaxID=689768 RepID=UPI00143A4773|nr:PPOX class F420-dependent oxidoreductase [Planosporangium mesophilum]NJC86733.1 PPOX class F420-dependent oxidoreductase [Planosporangium mesophilum]